MVPCRFSVSRQVFGFSLGVPVPRECAILNVPLLNTSVSTLLPWWSMPALVNTPEAMTLAVFEVGDVDMSWKCSVPEAATRAAAPAGAASHSAPALAAAGEAAAMVREVVGFPAGPPR